MPHPRNKHKEGYDFDALKAINPALLKFVKPNKYGTTSIDFANHQAIKALNQALLKQYYEIYNWDIPAGYLIPPIPGRADYIHHLADLLGLPAKAKCLDIGTGANCIYPLIAVNEYGWEMVGAEIDSQAIKVAKAIIANNLTVKNKIEIRHQTNPDNFFEGIVKPKEYFDACLCNPPFHSSAEEANAIAVRKFNNLNMTKDKNVNPNFQGQSNELWCKGGEERFIRNMIYESKHFAESFGWFTTLVSKKGHLRAIYKALDKVNAIEVQTIEMEQGNKKSRFVAWRF
ncbi:23S rRNA m(6)A-1618 methyltransferase [Spirosomataceae bacterium TFI 002]|nr:23S rRNA m(6)A-1618 methyltransferase [Spirosomataceae bacterium TFI 002]